MGDSIRGVKEKHHVKTNPSDEQLDRIFFALSDRTRRGMLAQLSKGETSVSTLAEPYNMSLPAVLKHLGILRDAGLITEEKEGRIKRCKLDPKELKKANEWISFYSQFWKTQFDELENYLERLDKEDKKRKK